MRASMRTWMVAIAGLGMVALVRSLVLLEVAPGRVVISDIGEAAIVSCAALILLVGSLRLTRDEGRTAWVLLGLGAASFALGDIVWTIDELGTGTMPFPGPADVFYLLEYAFAAAALILAARRLGDGADPRSAVLLTGLTVIVLLGLLYGTLIRPHLLASDMGPAELVLSVFYPVTDVLLLVGPSVFLLIIVRRRNDPQLLLPWATVAASMVLMAATDAGFSWLVAVDAYVAGGLVDYGWMISHVLLGVAVSLALDTRSAARPYGVVLEDVAGAASGTYGMTPPEEETVWDSQPLL